MPRTSRQARIGKAVKVIRTTQGLTQEGLAAKADLHPTYISDVERGVRNPSWEAISRLAKGMGVGVAEIAADYDRRAK